MSSSEADKTVYALLGKTVGEKAYGAIELNKALERIADKKDKPYITALFYGVLRKSLQFDFIINSLCGKPPKNAVKYILKIGLYKLRYMNVPDHAAVCGAVELAKAVGKGGAAGFVNAVLKKSAAVKLPEITDVKSLSVNASVPEFLARILVSDYGFEFARDMLTAKPETRTHIRRNGLVITESDFKAKYAFLTEKTRAGGYYVTHNELDNLEKRDYIVQSLSSMLAVRKFFDSQDRKILDVCAAPGGKAVYMYELGGGTADVTACDIHPHRVALIEKYAGKTGAKITAEVSDATVFRKEFKGAFDSVVCDVPCSGIGVIDKKPEILLKISPSDFDGIERIQLAVLSNASRYVRRGGRLCYSTCTVLKRENDGVVESFLKENKSFGLCGEPLRLFPQDGDCDGFFAAVMKKNED